MENLDEATSSLTDQEQPTTAVDVGQLILNIRAINLHVGETLVPAIEREIIKWSKSLTNQKGDVLEKVKVEVNDMLYGSDERDALYNFLFKSVDKWDSHLDAMEAVRTVKSRLKQLLAMVEENQ